MNKRFRVIPLSLSTLVFVLGSFFILGVKVVSAAPIATLDVYTISNIVISPNNASSTGVLDDTSIDIRFTSEVTNVSMDMIDSLGGQIKHLYDATDVTNPTPKIWTGQDDADSFVADDVYTVQIVYTDAGGTATDTSQTITVDNTSPVITLSGTDPIDLTVGDVYVDAGATSSDDVDGDLTSSIVTVNPVDTATVGTYTVTYDVTDSAGNPATQVSRTVNVNPVLPPDTTAPIITLLGSNPVNLTVGDVYVDAGATSSDDVDGDLTSSIVTVNPVDTATVGTYTVTYDVTDSAGNPATQVSRTVNVNPVPVESIVEPERGNRSGGYVRGWEPNGPLTGGQVLGTSTGRVLGASTNKARELAMRKKIRRIKGLFNGLKSKIYDLEHQSVASADQVETTEETATSVITDLEATTTASTTPIKPAKPWWRFW